MVLPPIRKVAFVTKSGIRTNAPLPKLVSRRGISDTNFGRNELRKKRDTGNFTILVPLSI